jgi:hypothetical protein
MMNQGPKTISLSSEKGLFITWTLAEQFMEISHVHIGLSIAEITAVL